MQFHTDQAQEDVATALPDVEVFHVGTLATDDPSGIVSRFWPTDEGWEGMTHGWYWWPCQHRFPDDASGPFDTEALAIAHARKDGE